MSKEIAGTAAPPKPEFGREPVRPIFLFGLPRSGTTLLQRIIGAHPQVATVAEPWILLPLVYITRPHGALAEYRHFLAATAAEDFIAELRGGRTEYDAALRDLVLRLYGAASAGKEARYFLDKTPRYTLIADDICRMFPDAKMVVLWRNPLAILASIISTWEQGRWRPWRHNVDLFAGLANLTATVSARPERFYVMNYEKLVSEPEPQIRRLFRYLDLDYQSSLLSEFVHVDWSGRMGDETGRAAYTSIETSSLDKWRDDLAGIVRRRWALHWLDWIGSERLALMGYEHSGLRAEFEGGSTRAINSTRPMRTVGDAANIALGCSFLSIQRLLTGPRFLPNAPVFRRATARN